MQGSVSFPDRHVAGQVLAEMLRDRYADRDCIVLALPRGGVPVAAEVARVLGTPLDVILVRKLGLPGHAELAMGALASGGVRVMNDDVVRRFGVDAVAIEAVAEAEARELARRERVYRGARPWPKLEGRCVILVDDGLATGATMQAAVDAVRAQRPAHIVIAVPVAPPETVREFAAQVDEVICPLQPASFMAIGQWYRDFSQVSDEEVLALLDDLAPQESGQ